MNSRVIQRETLFFFPPKTIVMAEVFLLKILGAFSPLQKALVLCGLTVSVGTIEQWFCRPLKKYLMEVRASLETLNGGTDPFAFNCGYPHIFD